jgi:hypothetical protein
VIRLGSAYSPERLALRIRHLCSPFGARENVFQNQTKQIFRKYI